MSPIRALNRRTRYQTKKSPRSLPQLVRHIQHVHYMQHLGMASLVPHSRLQLHHAAGVGGDNQVGGGGPHLLHLVTEKAGREVALQHGVGASAATAETGVLHLHELQAGYAAQEFPRRLADALGMYQVAGILEGSAQR